MQPYYSTSGAKNDRINVLRCHFMLEMPSFYQDRLGTNKHRESSIFESMHFRKGIMRFSARRFALGHRRERRRHRLRVQHGWALLAGRENGLVLRHFYSKTPNVCQDRLGTNIGKVNAKAILSLSQVETLNRTLVFIRALKAKRPEMPVLLIEGHDHARAWISPPTALQQNQTREAYRR